MDVDVGVDVEAPARAAPRNIIWADCRKWAGKLRLKKLLAVKSYSAISVPPPMIQRWLP